MVKPINIVGVIPARMASSRFPGKPLKRILGLPMIGHVYFRSVMSKALNDLYVATCDQEIIDYTDKINAKSVMTASTHERASDRAAEAMLEIERRCNKKVDILVMIQGDEPMLYPEMIDDVVNTVLNDNSIQVANLMAALKSKGEHSDPNEVKVVTDRDNYALYFSREPIPSGGRGAIGVPMFKQVPIIPFRRDFLIKFNKLEPTSLEKIESIDMLRVLEHGYKVKMVYSKYDTYSVDTPEDLKEVENMMRQDPLVQLYKKTL